jgi:hypothetical protein
MSIEIDKFVRSQRRTIALIVERDGSLTVRAPKRAALKDIQSFLRQKADWIIRTREKLKSIVEPAKKQYAEGEKFPFLGNEYELKLVRPQRPALKFDQGFYLEQTVQSRARDIFEKWYKKQASSFIPGRVRAFAELHGFTPKRVKITSAKTRWGSCSPDGTLNFSWRLVMAPPEVIDYVVVHELAHLRVKSHSRRFWKVVEGIFPGHKTQRKWLREHGERLTL